jgi:hypothetical protein
MPDEYAHAALIILDLGINLDGNALTNALVTIDIFTC